MLTDEPLADVVKETNRIISSAVAKIETKIPEAMRMKLLEDVFVFSGCKTFVSLNEAATLLWDKEKNRVKTFDQFFKDVSSVHADYNKNYLKAEYQFAVHSSQSAAKWKEIEADGDRYNLQYRTAGDSRVRDSHNALREITLPPSDPFWAKYYPPNGWRCRCVAVQVRKGKYKTTDPTDAMTAGDAATEGKKEQMFRFNPGVDKQVFPPQHPYYKVKDEIKKELDSLKPNNQ